MAEKSLCSIPDCGKPACNSRGWCNGHYWRWRKYGDPQKGGVPREPPYEGALCSVTGCRRPAQSRGWCHVHYRRWKQHDDPLGGCAFKGESEAFLRETVLPFDGDECLIWPFQRGRKGYARIKLDGKTVIVPRVVCEHVNGPAPSSSHEAAHNCGKGHLGCVNPRHLRWATPLENSFDRFAHETYFHKLSEDEVREIRSLKGIQTQQAIANKFGVSRGTIKDILNEKTWRRLL